jgi:hypothetical protein
MFVDVVIKKLKNQKKQHKNRFFSKKALIITKKTATIAAIISICMLCSG